MAADGSLLYLLADNDLVILELAGEDSRLLSRTRIGDEWSGRENAGILSGSERIPTGLYYAGGRLAVIYDCYGYESASGEMDYTEYTGVDIFDVADPAAPVRMTSYGQDGIYCAAGLDGDTLCLVTEYAVFSDDSGSRAESPVPNMYFNGAESPMEAWNIYFAQDGCFAGYSVIGAYDLAAPRRADLKALLGVSADVCAGAGEMYFYSPRYAETLSRSFDGFTENAQIACTDIFRFSVGEGGLELTTATVNGVLPGSGCMDVHGGTLRLVTALEQRLYPVSGGDTEYAVEETVTGTAVYTLDGAMSPLGKTEVPAAPEELRWVGYMGDTAVISLRDEATSIPVDFSDPALPAAGDVLSDYVTALAVYPWGEDGYTAFAREAAGKLELTVYDGTFRALARRSFGSDYSSTLESIQSYLSDSGENLIGFSADDGYCVYGFSAGEGIYFRGDVFLNDWAWNARGLSLGQYFYVIDRHELFVSEKDDLTSYYSIAF